eukprot:TRINITY_DN20711_c0_g1_i1.p2 TRINITY_DN20711_c0_g1~~TRINITY_DN20711_c0_g1_i1.p2  ORF type:complete len:125 (-),score=19.36 TRINITY_DN20711_c0_g1_i1:139-513(-)
MAGVAVFRAGGGVPNAVGTAGSEAVIYLVEDLDLDGGVGLGVGFPLLEFLSSAFESVDLSEFHVVGVAGASPSAMRRVVGLVEVVHAGRVVAIGHVILLAESASDFAVVVIPQAIFDFVRTRRL